METSAWTFSPLWIPGLLLLLLEVIGIRRLRSRASQKRAKQWRWRGVSFGLGIAIVCGVDSSPLMGQAMNHLTVHMLLHVIEMFYVPILLLLGAPGLAGAFALPVESRRRILRWWNLGPTRALTTSLAALVSAPIVALVFFNGLMLFWHLPVIFNWASWHPWVHTWLMTPSYVLSGYLFWRMILPAGPWPPRASTRFQLLSVASTAFSMLVLAIALGVMSRGAWYSMNLTMLGPTAAFNDQQFAAGILWICGDFWVIPALLVIGRRVISDEGSIGAAFERRFGRTAP